MIRCGFTDFQRELPLLLIVLMEILIRSNFCELQFHMYWVDAKVSADFLKNVFKRCSATMDAWFSCI